jgi:malto-oligosyltrehalose trehalohydrolase
MTDHEWRLSFGAHLVEKNKTRFRLWAPAQNNVSVEIQGGGPQPMTAAGDGWFEALVPCGAGTLYQFVLEDGRAVPDPASRAQHGDIHGYSIVVDPAAYSWRQSHWHGRPWHETILYELHVGLLGGFRGVIDELPRLAELGITAVELMPIAEFPGGRNWGYDGALPYAPEASYGQPDDLKELIDAAHAHGLMIFLDVVYNHFGPDGNYLSAYAPQFFRDDVTTPWGPAIDFRRSEVRRFFTDNALYWLLEYRFDGLRFDAVHAIPEPDWLDEMAAEVRKRIPSNRHVHLVLENDDNRVSYLAKDFDAQWNDDGHHILHVMLTNEHNGYYQDYAEDSANRLARCLKEGFIYQGEPSTHRGGKHRGSASGALPPTAFVLFLQNHDQTGNRALGERLTTLTQPRALEAATSLLLLCPQIPLIFMGEEDASETPFVFFTDHKDDLAQAVREGRRREFAEFFHSTDPSLIAQLSDPNEPATFHGSKPTPSPIRGKERRQFYRHLLSLRRREIVPRLLGTRALNASTIGPAAVIARWRLNDGAVLTIATNLAVEAVSLPKAFPDLLFASAPDAEMAAKTGQLVPQSTIALLDPA